MIKVLVFSGIIAIALGLSWGVTVGLVFLITICFHWPFTLLTATGIWLITLLVSSTVKTVVHKGD